MVGGLKNGWMHGQINEWWMNTMDGWMNGWTSRWTDRWMDHWMDGPSMDQSIDRLKNGWMHRCMEGIIDSQLNKPIDGKWTVKQKNKKPC